MYKRKILLAPNSFKECADSMEITELFEKYLIKNDNVEIEKYPISDGGDGFLKTIKYNSEVTELKYSITTPYDDSKFECEVLFDKINKTLFIESAMALGLQLIPKEKRHPLCLSSKGMGELLEQVNKSVIKNEIDVNKVIVGIGGTGTNDLGLGMCSVFGLKLTDIYGKEPEVIPENYPKTNNILWSSPKLRFKIVALVDVKNPLLGDSGATRQFAEQKGASEEEIKILETGFANIINILKNNGIRESFNSLSGAGGGLAAGLSLFLNAECVSSFENIGTDEKLIDLMEQADFILTGEGKFDETSLFGKGASAVIKLSEQLNKKVFLCCGNIDENSVKNYKNVIPIEMNEFTHEKEYRKYIENEIKTACGKIIAQIS